MTIPVEISPGCFEFNPAAPEFVPWQPQATDTLLSKAPSKFGPEADTALPRKETNSLTVSVSVQLGATVEALADEAGPVPVKRVTQQPVSQTSAPLQGTISRQGVMPIGATPGHIALASRRAAAATDALAQVATLVIKNLALDLNGDDVRRFLEWQGIPAADVELHLDSSSAFRGTAFARFETPIKARDALTKLGPHPEMGGRKLRVEIQKSNTLYGRKRWQAELPEDELVAVQFELERFLLDTNSNEIGLSPAFTVHQRKYAHSLAERFGLIHATRQNEGGETFVFLCKWRTDQPDPRKKVTPALAPGTKSSASSPLLRSEGEELPLKSVRVGNTSDASTSHSPSSGAGEAPPLHLGESGCAWGVLEPSAGHFGDLESMVGDLLSADEGTVGAELDGPGLSTRMPPLAQAMDLNRRVPATRSPLMPLTPLPPGLEAPGWDCGQDTWDAVVLKLKQEAAAAQDVASMSGRQ